MNEALDVSPTIAIVALALLVVAFLIGSITELHMGICALVSAALVGPLLMGDTLKVVTTGWPTGLMITLIGVTYLFALATNNGTVDWIVAACLRLVGGNVKLMPWAIFIISMILSGVGSATPATCAIMLPIGLAFGIKYGVNPLIMTMAVVQGSGCGSFSPMGVYGAITQGVVDSSGLTDLYHRNTTFIMIIAFNLALMLIVMLLYRKPGPTPEEAAKGAKVDIDQDALKDAMVDEEFGESKVGSSDMGEMTKAKLNTERTITLIGILAMAVIVLVTGQDVGYVALAVAAVITLIFPRTAKGSVMQIAWPTVLLVCGIVTYISMLERHGIIEWLGILAANLGNPKFSVILVLLVGSLGSAFASTTGLLGALIPLSVPFLNPADPTALALNTTAVIASLGISASGVDISPFSTAGALAVANSQHMADYHYKQVFNWAWYLIFGLPVATWAVFILPGIQF